MTDMEYRRLGDSGLVVSALGLGANNFGRRIDVAATRAVVDAALDAGVNLIDTADSYGESETYLGEVLEGRRDQVVLATKFGSDLGGANGPDWGARGSRRYIRKAVERSLRRLRTDWIDLYQIHRNDKDTPLEETLSALSDLVRQGKVRYLGVSTGTLAESRSMYFGGWKMVESLWISEKRNFERFVSTQPPYSILRREAEREIFPVCRAHGFGAIVWSPLEGGWLAGRYRKGKPAPEDSRAKNQTEFGAFVAEQFDLTSARGQRRLDIVETLAGMADELGVPLAHYALAWVLRNQDVTSAIVGVREMRHLEDAIKAEAVRIPDEHLRRIDALVGFGENA